MASPFYLAFDTETGGLNPKEADILTIYLAILDENFKILEELDLKLKPNGNRLPIAHAEALKVNKIDLHSHILDPNTISYSDAKDKIVIMVKKYLKKTGRYSNIRPLGYNLDFDINFVQEYILPYEEWETLINYNDVDPKICVNFLKDCGWFPKELGSLVSVVKYLDIPMGNAHNARADTLATIEVYKRLIDMVSSKKNGGQEMDLISLLEAE